MGIVWSYVSGKEAAKQGVFFAACHVNADIMGKLKAVGIEKKQMYALHKIFSEMDRDNSGEINIGEFFAYVDLERSKFSEKAFSVMDKDGSGEVDFIEFVLAVWNYCSFSHASLVRYAFDLYDLDGSGEIELLEAKSCVQEIWGREWERSANAHKVLTKLESVMAASAGGKLTIKMFQEFVQRHPILLFPAFQLQTEIQQCVLGSRFWRQAAKRRASMDPVDLSWLNFKAIAAPSRQNSRRLLESIDDAVEAGKSERHLFKKKPAKPKAETVGGAHLDVGPEAAGWVSGASTTTPTTTESSRFTQRHSSSDSLVVPITTINHSTNSTIGTAVLEPVDGVSKATSPTARKKKFKTNAGAKKASLVARVSPDDNGWAIEDI